MHKFAYVITPKMLTFNDVRITVFITAVKMLSRETFWENWLLEYHLISFIFNHFVTFFTQTVKSVINAAIINILGGKIGFRLSTLINVDYKVYKETCLMNHTDTSTDINIRNPGIWYDVIVPSEQSLKPSLKF